MTRPSSEPSGASLDTARVILRSLGFPAAQSNDRAGRVLLALLGLTPGQDWDRATNQMLTTVELMARIRDHWGKAYAPNTRETIRRFTLHQFTDAGLTEYNHDDPRRPVNSAKNNYRVAPEALRVIQAFDTDGFEELLDRYLALNPGLVLRAAAARELHRIPVTLPSGAQVTLSPGGQNELIKLMVDEFCPRFTHGGHVLYLCDADAKLATFDPAAFAALGLAFDTHGKMPDLVVYLPDRNWLVLLEAASTHGPVDVKRHAELRTLFADSTAGLVFVSCFPDRATMRKYLEVLAWETEAWVADHPDHMIHFNGDRFLGPYPTG